MSRMNISHEQIHEKSELVFLKKKCMALSLSIPIIRFFALGRIKGGVKCGATKWFWIHDPLIGYPES